MLGLYSAFTRDPNNVPGLEFAGVVVAVGDPLPTPAPLAGQAGGSTPGGQQEQGQEQQGEPARPLRVGDRVVGVTRFGAFATTADLATPYLRRWGGGGKAVLRPPPES